MRTLSLALNFRSTWRRVLILFGVLFAAFFFVFGAAPAHAAVITWDGGGSTNDWSEDANWSGDTEPGSGDIATFDATSTKDGTIDASFGASVAGIDINTGYTGTITQARAFSIGANDFEMADGIYLGGSTATTMTDQMTISGGAFTPTSDVWTVYGTLTFTGGTINGTGKTLVFGTCGAASQITGFTGDFNAVTGLSVLINNNCGGAFVVLSGQTLTATIGASLASNLTVQAGATLTTLGATSVNLLTNLGSFTAGAGAFFSYSNVSFDGATNNLDASTSITTNGNLSIGSGDTLTLNPAVTTVRVLGAYTNDGTFDLTGRTLHIGGCGTTSQINYTAGDFNAATGATVIISNNCGGPFTVPTGQTLTASITPGTAGAYTVQSGATFTVSGAVELNTLNNLGSFTAGAGAFLSYSNVIFDGATNNLNASTSILIGGNLTVGTGDTLTLNPAVTSVRIYGQYTNDGTFSLTGRTLNFGTCGSNSQINYTSGDFNAATGALVIISNHCGGIFTVPTGQTLTASFAGSLTPIVTVQAGAALAVSGNTDLFQLNNLGSFTAGTGSFLASQNVLFDGTVNDLRNSTSGNIDGTFTVGSGDTLQLNAITYSLASTFTNDGTITSTGGTATLLLDSNPTTTFSTASVLPLNLTINRSSGTTTFGSDVLLTGNFTRTDGAIGNPASGYVLSVAGNFSSLTSDTFGGANLSVIIDGTGTQNLSSLTTLTIPFTITKASGVAQLMGGMVFTTSPVTVQDGTLFLNGYTLMSSGGFEIESGATLQLIGNEGAITSPTLDAGSIVKYVGDGDTAADDFGYHDFAYDNLVFAPIDSDDTFGPQGTNTLLTGLVAYYPFTEGTGASTVDGSGNGYTGTLTNMENADWSADVPTSSYVNDYSLEFDGTSEFVDLGNPSLLPAGSAPRTICAWTNSDTVGGGFHTIFSYGTVAGLQLFTYGYDNNTLYSNIFFGDSATSGLLSASTWTHVCQLYDGTEVVLYINGVERARTAVAVNTVKSTTRIGYRVDSNFAWDGKIDEVRAYDRALSTDELTSLSAGDNVSGSAAVTDLDINGTLTLSGGTLILPTGTTTVSGDLIKSAGTIDPNGGTVDLGDGSQEITGAWTFENLIKTVTSAATLTLPASTTQTINGTLTLQGIVDELLSLVSSSPMTQARINPSGSRTLGYLDVTDNFNLDPVAMNCGLTCNDGGRNTGWVFSPGFTIGTISGNTTEAGGTATFTVVLDAPPSASVTIPVSSSDTSEGTVDTALLTFTTGNWDDPQTVTVTGVNDDLDDGDTAYTILLAPASSADGTYDGLDPSDVGVINTDNDSSNIIVGAISGNTTEAGATANFTIVLSAQPSASVSIGVSSSDTTEGTVSTGTVTFNTDNWATPQTVTVTGVNDFIDDGDIGYTIVLATASSLDPSYNGINPADVSVTNVDNDTSAITVGTISGHTTEAGGTATFTVVLTTFPSADVTIGLTSNDTTEGTVSPSSLTFTNGNGMTPQTVTVTGVNDVLLDGNIAFSIITAAAASADVLYNGINPSDVSVTNDDNDTAGFLVSAISRHTTEAGQTATFTVSLTVQPTDDVTTGVTSSDTTEGTVAISSLVFTNGNWDTPQTVTVTGVDDLIDDGDIAYSIILAAATSTDTNFNGVNPSDVSVVNDDNDTIGATVSAISGNTTEAGVTATFTVVLTSQPSSDVTIGVSSNDTTEGTVAISSLVFTNGNWDTPQTVTVTGVNDVVDDGDIAYSIILAAASSADSNYNGYNPSDVSVTNTDNDTAAFSVSSISANTTEAGGTGTFTVVLTSQPSADATIGLTSSDTTEGTIVVSSLTFTNGNWDTPQAVTVTGVDDVVNDGDVAYAIVTAVSTSADPGYNGLNPPDVAINNIDNENAGFSVSAISGNTTEAGGTATFTVVLTSQPSADVTVGISSGDLTEGTVSPSSLTFTNGNWNTPRTVTVTGVNDDLDDGNIGYTILTAAAVSGDSDYDGLDPADVSVTNVDNDISGFSVSGISNNTTEAGVTGTFTVVLQAQPSADVTINISSSDLSEGTVSPGFLTFTGVNWATPRTVTVTGVNDDVDDGNIIHSIITGVGSSADSNYNGLDPNDVSVTNVDNDTVGVTITQTGGTTDVEEGGATDTYTIVLNTQPTSTVTITLSSDAQVDTDVPSIIFTTGNWDNPETVTVTAVDDQDVEGNHTGVITHSASSSDGNYNALSISSVTANITDNDTASGGSSGGFQPPQTQRIDVLAPSAGMEISGGADYLITWETTGRGMDYVDIYYVVDGISHPIVQSLLNRESYNWHVPSLNMPDVAIKVVGTDLVDEAAVGFSGHFSIKATQPETPPVNVDDGFGPSPVTGEQEMITPVGPGSYIKGNSYSTVYYVDELLVRHPFLNEQTFFTYEPSFAHVMTVTDATLASLTFDGPMTPKPFTVLVKIKSSPKIYFVGPGNTLRAVPDEATAAKLFGSNWADYVIDVDPTELANFSQAAPMMGNETVDRSILVKRRGVR